MDINREAQGSLPDEGNSDRAPIQREGASSAAATMPSAFPETLLADERSPSILPPVQLLKARSELDGPNASRLENGAEGHLAALLAPEKPLGTQLSSAPSQAQLVKICRRRYDTAELENNKLRKTGFYTTSLPIQNPGLHASATADDTSEAGKDGLKGLVDDGSRYCKERGDILMFEDFETLRVFVSKYMGRISEAPKKAAPVGFKGLDLSSVIVAWEAVPGACDLTDLPGDEDLDQFLGISYPSVNPLFEHIPRNIGRLLEVAEQLGQVKRVTLVYKSVEEIGKSMWGEEYAGDAIQNFFLPIFWGNWIQILNDLLQGSERPVYTWMRMQHRSWIQKPRFYETTEVELLSLGANVLEAEATDSDGDTDDDGEGEFMTHVRGGMYRSNSASHFASGQQVSDWDTAADTRTWGQAQIEARLED